MLWSLWVMHTSSIHNKDNQSIKPPVSCYIAHWKQEEYNFATTVLWLGELWASLDTLYRLCRSNLNSSLKNIASFHCQIGIKFSRVKHYLHHMDSTILFHFYCCGMVHISCHISIMKNCKTEVIMPMYFPPSGVLDFLTTSWSQQFCEWSTVRGLSSVLQENLWELQSPLSTTLQC